MADNAPAPDVDSGGSINLGEPDLKGRRISPWAWVPSVNFLQGMQYILVTQMFIVVFYTMGIPNGTAIFWLGLLGLPWTIKPLWGPLVDRYWTKRNWTTTMQLLVGAALLGAAATVVLPDAPIAGLPTFFVATLLVLFVVAFASATHDIACDGYYMIALREKQQAFFVGIRSTAFRVGWIFTLGPLVALADYAQEKTGPSPEYFQVGAVTAADESLALLPELPPATSDGNQRILFFVAEPAEAETGGDDGATEAVESAPAEAPPPVYSEARAVDVARGGSGSMFVRLAADPGADKTLTVVLKQIEPGLAGDVPFLEFAASFFRPKKLIGEVKADPTAVRFTSDNWNKPQEIKITVDKKLDQPAAAVFKVTGGNVALGWAVVLLAAGGLYFVLAIYHRFRMPIARGDAVETANRPPFHVPALAVAATILVPFLLGYTAFRVMMQFQSTVGPHLFGAALSAADAVPKDKKLYDFLYKLVAIAIPSGIGFALFFVPVLKDYTRSFFRKMSDVSRIGFVDVFTTFFSKPRIGVVISFLLLYRLGEIPLSSLKTPFLLATRENGGIDMTLSEFAFTNSFIYVIALILGGLLSGWLISSFGLKRIIWILVAFMHLPNTGYVFLAHYQPENLVLTNAIIAFESFGYGVGLSAFLMVMILSAQGPYKTAHYALCTGFMALGVMIPQMPSGYIQEVLGYEKFFIMACLLVIPSCFLIPFLPIDTKFGRKEQLGA